MRIVTVLLVALLCLLIVGCMSLTPKQQAQLDRLEAEIEAGRLESQRIYDAIADARQKWKDGKLTADEAIALLDSLYEQSKRVAERVVSLQVEYKKTKDAGVPWYYILWGVISTAAAAALKGATNDLIGGVEKGGDKGTKKAVAGFGNILVNWLVKRRTPAKSGKTT